MVQRFYPKRCSSCCLAETIANTEELLTEILVRVPATPLVRFKCVSKHWLSLISDPKFCHRHTLQNPNTPISAVFCDTSPPPKTHNQPVLHIYSSSYCCYFHMLMYSSETRSWKLLDSSFSREFQILYERVEYCNGAIHWLGMFSELSYFCVDEERIGVVDPPPRCKEKNFDKRIFRYFRESGDRRHLHLIDIYVPCISQFEVLEMGKDYSGWFVKYFVDLDPICTTYPWFRLDRFIILFLAQDEIEGEECSSLLLHTAGKVITYNLKSKTFKSFELAPKAGVDDCLLRVGEKNYRYVETLACV